MSQHEKPRPEGRGDVTKKINWKVSKLTTGEVVVASDFGKFRFTSLGNAQEHFKSAHQFIGGYDDLLPMLGVRHERDKRTRR